MMFGSPPDQPADTWEHVQDLRENLEKARQLAREHLKKAQKRQKQYHDTKGTGQAFGVGDRVWLFNSATKKGESRKLQSPWVGPFIIVDRISEVNYKIQPENNADHKQLVHNNRLQLCKAQPQNGNGNLDADGVRRHTDTTSHVNNSDDRSHVPDDTDLLYSEDPPVFLQDEPHPECEQPLTEDQEHVPPMKQRRVVRPLASLQDYEVNLS